MIVMVGPSLQSRGGIASVVGIYDRAGLFEKWAIRYLHSHVEGAKTLKLLVALKALRTFATLLMLRRVQILHIHMARNTSFWRKSLFILLAYATKCPVCIHLHSGGFPDFYWKRCGPSQKLFVRFILDHAARVIVLSSQWRALLGGITKNTRITQIPNFVIDVQNQPISYLREKYALLFLGRLNVEKGFFDLLEAAVVARQKFPEFMLRCGGEGDMNSVTSAIKELGIESNVTLLGWVEEEDRLKLFDSATIFVLPSYIEGVPMGILEAMAAGVPCIATTVGGIPDVIEPNVDGILVAPGDVHALANAIVLLLGDENMRTTMGAAAKKKISERFSAEAVVPQLEAIYRELGALPTGIPAVTYQRSQ